MGIQPRVVIQGRDFEILMWVLHMSFSTNDDISGLFFKGKNPHRAPYRRLLKLVKAGLLDMAWTHEDHRPQYVATARTVRYLRRLGFLYVPALPKNRNFFKNYQHEREVQDVRILFRELGLGVWIPERAIRTVKPRGASPDAILYNFDAQYAIEYENSEKEMQRYREIFDRYEEKEKYNGVLYILPTEARIEKIRRLIPAVPRNIYFLSKGRLVTEREKASFESSSKTLPLKHLIQYSFPETYGALQELDPADLKALVQSEEPDAWKDRKPFTPYGGGRGSRGRDEDEDRWDEYEEGQESGYPSIYPPMYPGETDDYDDEYQFQ